MKRMILMLCMVVHFVSCNDKKSSNSTSGTTLKTETLGEAHFLENDGIQLQLPNNFERYSSAKYEALMETFLKGPILKLEQQRLRHLRKIDGNHYIFFHDSTKSTITVNTLQYQPITKEDAKTILADIIRDQNEIGRITKKEYTRISTSYSDGVSAQVLKSVFKVSDKTKKKKKTEDRFQHKYYISSQDNYVIIDVNTSMDIDFDKYLEKIKF